jgi:ribosomal protein S18 acetylase RimI-like enzyme
VRVDNDAAISLYQRLGYEHRGEIADYYEDGQMALLFLKHFA